jgi:hypothetical protein
MLISCRIFFFLSDSRKIVRIQFGSHHRFVNINKNGCVCRTVICGTIGTPIGEFRGGNWAGRASSGSDRVGSGQVNLT